jgi:pimeloyl-ACP methyl ester carboxylesterase
MTEQFCDVGRGITLCYETFGDASDPPAVMIMGLSVQMLAWPDDFCRALADRGLYVVRFDNRDIGHSTHLRTRPPAIPQLLLRSVLRPRNTRGYRLSDMALDTVGLIDGLGLSPAHVIGASMGGMIAQTLASRHPDRVRSLVSIMSNTGARFSGQPKLAIYPAFLQRPPRSREAYIDAAEKLFAVIGSRGLPQDTEDVRAIAAASYDRDHGEAGPARQLAAIIASGDRRAELTRITAPTLVIHGTDDRLVGPSGGRATARAIAGARLMLIEGMGHDLPRAAWPRMVDAIAEHVAHADRGARRAPTPSGPRGVPLGPAGVGPPPPPGHPAGRSS